MSVTLEGRLLQNTGKAVWNDLSPKYFLVSPMGNCNYNITKAKRAL